jgi:son of sevenless-like protein
MLRDGLLRAVGGRSEGFSADSASLYVLCNPPEPLLPAPVLDGGNGAPLDSFFSLDVGEVARQLTLVAHELFCRVRPADLKPSLAPASLSLSDGGQGSALQTLSALHERTACWVASEVVLSRAAAERAGMLARFVALADALRTIRNYHGFFAVMAGLALKPVERLRSSWRTLPADVAARYEQLSELTSPASAFAAYRAELAAARLPAFPAISLVVTDVRALELSASDFADELRRDVNYKKLRAFAAVYSTQVRPYQLKQFPFAPVQAVQEYLSRAVVVAHMADLYKISLQCEPLT